MGFIYSFSKKMKSAYQALQFDGDNQQQQEAGIILLSLHLPSHRRDRQLCEQSQQAVMGAVRSGVKRETPDIFGGCQVRSK